MSLNPITLINELIVERGSAVVMGKHLALIKDQVIALQNEVETLKKENVHLREEAARYRGQIAYKLAADEFVEHRGLLFKRKAEGGYHELAYCPHCKIGMASGFPNFPLQCSKCKYISDVRGNAVREIITSLQ